MFARQATNRRPMASTVARTPAPGAVRANGHRRQPVWCAPHARMGPFRQTAGALARPALWVLSPSVGLSTAPNAKKEPLPPVTAQHARRVPAAMSWQATVGHAYDVRSEGNMLTHAKTA